MADRYTSGIRTQHWPQPGSASWPKLSRAFADVCTALIGDSSVVVTLT